MLKKFTKKDRRTKLEKEIESVLCNLRTMDPSSEAYTTATQNLERLHKMKSEDKFKVSPDTVMVVAGSLIGTILVLYFERTGVVTSKALGWLMKGRV